MTTTALLPKRSSVNVAAPIASLTAIRFIASLWVVLYHLLPVMQSGSALPALFPRIILCGYMGVSFFFILSGFILAYSYAARPLKAGRFWRARAARILPMYLVSLALAAPFFLRAVVHGALSLFPALITAPLLLQAWLPGATDWNPPGWSLSCEAFFYFSFPAVLPVCIKVFRSKMRWPAFAALWLLATAPALIFAIFHRYGIHDHVFGLDQVKYNPLLRLPEFLLGIGAGILFFDGLRIPRPRIVIFAIAALILAIVAITSGNPYPAFHNGIFAPLIALLLLALASAPKFMGSPTLILLGEASYSLYLIHTPLRDICSIAFHKLHLVPGSVLFGLVYLTGSVLASVAAYKYIEVPAKRWLLDLTGK